MKINIIITYIVLTLFLSLPLFLHGQNDYWYQKVSLFDKLPVEEGDIIFLGNSITDGGEFQELLDREDVKNRGIVGDVISGVNKRLYQVTSGHPSMIFLLIGINDVSHGHSASKIAEAYLNLVKRIHDETPNTVLYIQSVMPINNDFKRYKNLIGKESVIPELNEQLREIAENNEAVYVDLWPLFADSETGKMKKEYTTDGLHLSGTGYKVWASALKTLIEGNIQNSEHETEEYAPVDTVIKINRIE